MSYQELLKIIHDECIEQDGFATGDTVKRRYGPDFDNQFTILVQRGFISREGPVGSISLTVSGWSAAENL